MREFALANKFIARRSESKKQAGQYYSVEFSIGGSNFTYQFKIWDTSATPMCLLVKEDSHVLRWLKAGDILNMRYYPADSVLPSDCLKTAIRHITKNDQGRFKGHYLIGLEILENEDQEDQKGAH